MTLSDSEDESRHPVDVLSEDYARRLRAGERPTIEEYVARCPDHADLLRSILPSIAIVERVSNHEAEQRRAEVLSSPRPASLPKVPNTLGDFEIVREIGRGGMGVVYEAIQRSLNRHVALKVISGLISSNEVHRARFRREAEAAASLHHTNIVPIYGIGEDHGLQYYAMQLIDGVTLADVVHGMSTEPANGMASHPPDPQSGSSRTSVQRVVRSNPHFDCAHAVRWMLSRSSTGPIPAYRTKSNGSVASQPTKVADPDQATVAVSDIQPETPSGASEFDVSARPARARETRPAPLTREYFRNVARIIANAANALDYAHHQRILHRDIKPANLLLDRDGTLWITDFGLARNTEIEGGTIAGEVMGTLRYMAPEQIAGHGDARTDVYSLGLTLFELLTLREAIEAPKARLLDPQRHSNIPLPRSIQANVPQDLQTITLKACAFAPEDRYQRASELEEDLQRFLEDRPILAKRASQFELLVRWGRRNPAIASLLSATLALLLLIAGMLGVWNRQQQRLIVEKDIEYRRAERNLDDKTAALTRVEQEHVRAEKNLELALNAFDQVINNIASRGSTLSAGSGLDDDDLLDLSDATLSQADIELLESLFQFFDKFSEENSKDLQLKSAVARQRVGDIQHKLGKLDEAEASYAKAAKVFQAAVMHAPDQPESLLPLIAIHNELLIIMAKRGQILKATTKYQEARKWLSESPTVNASAEGRFALAKLLNSIGTLGSRFGRDQRARQSLGPFGRAPNRPNALPAAQLARLKQEANFNAEALGLLQQLVAEDPNHAAYQVVLARTLKDHARIARMTGESSSAEESLVQAIGIFETLCRSHPDSAAFEYELADTLNTHIGVQPNDQQRCQRALEICERISKENPHVPEYRALNASILVRLSEMSGRTARAEELLSTAIKIQRELTARYSDIAAYSLALTRSLAQTAELSMAFKKPNKAIERIDEAILEAERLQRSIRGKGLVKPYVDLLRDRKAAYEKRLGN